jgi:hypothetical protein
MTDYPSSKSLETFFYDGQIRNRLTQIAAVFSGLQVSIGKNDFNSTSNLIRVPIRYGNADRVVNAILAENAQKPIALPIMSIYVSSIDMAPELRKGVGTRHRKSVLPVGETFPNGIKVVERITPIPYKLIFDLSTYTSNEEHNFQIMEQILMLFDPHIQLQASDAGLDANKLFSVELISVNNQTNYPTNEDSRIIQKTFTFSANFFLSPPVNIKTNFIKEIKLRLEAITASDGKTTDYIKNVSKQLPEYENLFDIDRYEFPNPT